MKFGPVPLNDAKGLILGHNIAGPDGRRLLRKGKPLSDKDILTLQTLGRNMVYVARLEPDDLDENTAVRRVAESVMGSNLRAVGPTTGRVNLLATTLGIFRVDVERLNRINGFEGVTIATLAEHTAVQIKKITSTIKIIPYAVSRKTIESVEAIAGKKDPIITLDILPKKNIHIIFSGSLSIKERLLSDFAPLTERLENLDANIQTVDFIPLEDEAGESDLTDKLRLAVTKNADLIILAGETAIMDRQDIAPRALVNAGGKVECVGVPVDPGNLLMLGYLDEIPILGLPGCARSRKANIVDWVLPRLLVGDRLTRYDFILLGHRGLLEDTQLRPMPRSRVK
jgi:molybdenum cofactor cytidylyltransferase